MPAASDCSPDALMPVLSEAPRPIHGSASVAPGWAFLLTLTLCRQKPAACPLQARVARPPGDEATVRALEDRKSEVSPCSRT